jgi:hypothetical protein
VLTRLVEPETAGDPMSEQKWVRSSLRSLSRDLGRAGHPASPPTVARLLVHLGFSLRVNAKQREARSSHPDRQAQFTHLTGQIQEFVAAGQPIISVDTKKKELVGDFKNAGRAWCQQPEPVNVHDFPADSLGRAVPYGIYDLTRNQGAVYVGQSGDTPWFAVDAIAHWWQHTGRAAFPGTERLLILADAGGSNSSQARGWKAQLQEQLCDAFGLAVTVCHYPPGCSKWNPIEHRLFSHISKNWEGKPLRTWDLLLGYLRGTRTEQGLSVEATLLPGDYPTGRTVPDHVMQTLNLERHAICPQWNYTLRPRPPHGAAVPIDCSEVIS